MSIATLLDKRKAFFWSGAALDPLQIKEFVINLLLSLKTPVFQPPNVALGNLAAAMGPDNVEFLLSQFPNVLSARLEIFMHD